MSAKKKKPVGTEATAQAAVPPKAAAALAAVPPPSIEQVKDPKIASISIAEFKRTLQTAKHPASLAMIELVKQFCGDQPPPRGESGKAAWLVPTASQGTQTISEIKMTVEGKAMTFNVHADTHVWAILDLVQHLEKGGALTLMSKGKGDDSTTMKLATLKSGKPELVKNLQFYSK